MEKTVFYQPSYKIRFVNTHFLKEAWYFIKHIKQTDYGSFDKHLEATSAVMSLFWNSDASIS